jgi:hypothetical protein
VTRRGSVTTLTGVEATPKRRKGGDDVSWTDVNLTEPKIKKFYTVNSVAINGR